MSLDGILKIRIPSGLRIGSGLRFSDND